MNDVNENPFGNVIFSYTRAQALADGVLVDVTELAKEAGFSIPVAITAAVNAEVFTPTEEDAERYGQSPEGRLWDMFNVLRFGIRTCDPGTDILLFTVLIMQDGSLDEVQLKAIVGPGDNAEPVMTIMYPYED